MDANHVRPPYTQLDKTDVEILRVLQEPTSKPLTMKALAEQTNSPGHPGHHIAEQTVSDHFKAFDLMHLIKSHNVLLDAKKLGLGYQALVKVYFRAHDDDQLERFMAQALELPNVLMAAIVTGERSDVMLHVVTTDVEAYYDVRRTLHRLAGEARVETLQILKMVKNTTVLPLDHLKDVPLHNHRKNNAPPPDASPSPDGAYGEV